MNAQINDKFPNDLATNEWLNSLKKSTKSSYQTMWKYFLEYVGMIGDQILENRKTPFHASRTRGESALT